VFHYIGQPRRRAPRVVLPLEAVRSPTLVIALSKQGTTMVHRIKNSPYWHYDFRVRGQRFNSSTREKELRAARAVEREARENAKAAAKVVAGSMSLDHATRRYWQEVAQQQNLQPALTLHERVAAKFASFLEHGAEPEGYLYRHFAPNGDLLYVGITLSILGRTESHFRKAKWKDFICLIVVEPFETREELLEAEREAIRTEFPKYNQIANGHRHPIQELTQRQQAANQRHRNVLARRARRAADAAALNSTTPPDTTETQQ
jgi:hypothetical protein